MGRKQLYWPWYTSGAALAVCFLLAVILVKPIGVSTQFVIADGLLASWVNPDLVYEDTDSKSGYASTNAYLNKSGGKYAAAVAQPVNYGIIFVLSMIVGGLFASRIQHVRAPQMPRFHTTSFGKPVLRYLFAFLGGVLVLFGARLAGGCTSGHMMSGMMQTAVSGYLFAAAAFITAIPVAIGLYGKGGNNE